MMKAKVSHSSSCLHAKNGFSISWRCTCGASKLNERIKLENEIEMLRIQLETERNLRSKCSEQLHNAVNIFENLCLTEKRMQSFLKQQIGVFRSGLTQIAESGCFTCATHAQKTLDLVALEPLDGQTQDDA